jgi:hypothetical protein
MRPSATSLRGGEGLGRRKDAARNRPRSFVLRLAAKLSKAVGRVRARVTAWMGSVRSLPSRAVHRVRAGVRSPVRLAKYLFRSAKSLFMATIGEDRGFGFWWLMVTIAIALAIGLLVAVLLSPVIGILAALVVGIWMLIRRNRSSQSRKTAKPVSRTDTTLLIHSGPRGKRL